MCLFTTIPPKHCRLIVLVWLLGWIISMASDTLKKSPHPTSKYRIVTVMVCSVEVWHDGCTSMDMWGDHDKCATIPKHVWTWWICTLFDPNWTRHKWPSVESRLWLFARLTYGTRFASSLACKATLTNTWMCQGAYRSTRFVLYLTTTGLWLCSCMDLLFDRMFMQWEV